MNRIREFLRWPGGYDCRMRDWIDFALVVAFVCWVAFVVGGCAP